MEFLIILEILLLAAVIGAVLFIRKLAKRDKQASLQQTDNHTDKS